MIFLTERVGKKWDREVVHCLAQLDAYRLRQGDRFVTAQLRWNRARVVQMLVVFERWGCSVCLN